MKDEISKVSELRIEKIQIPVYGSEVWVVIADDWNEFIIKNPELKEKNGLHQSLLNEFNEFDDPTNEALSIGYIESIDAFVILFKPGIIEMSILVHEAKHTINNIFKFFRVQLDLNNDENECYWLGWLCDEINNVIDFPLNPTEKENIQESSDSGE